jgi:Domain of unknown function DUF29
MNAETRIRPPAADAYERDGYAWAMAQARLISERRFDEVDWPNVIEEIESVGRSERRSLTSNLYQIALHMLKWDAQPERRGNGWWHSIANHRDAAADDLRENPSLRALLPDLVEEVVDKARQRAARETRLPAERFAALSYTPEVLFEREIERPAEI